MFTNPLLTPVCAEAPAGLNEGELKIYQGYIDFFEEVYKTMQDNYYQAVRREDFDRFIENFNLKIYSQVENKEEKSNYVQWRSSAYLIDYLKDAEDTFSAFFPPKPAEEFTHKVLGERIDLGLEGRKVPEGFLLTKIEPRSDAYQKGMREEDIILKIDRHKAAKLNEEKIKELLTPEKGSKVKLTYLCFTDKKEKVVEVVSQEYYKQAVFMVPTQIPDVYCLEIKSFNRKTSEDMFRYLTLIKEQGQGASLIIDLRGNPGGPPLAAREISGFFLDPNGDFAYFQKRDRPKSLLTVPDLPEKFHFTGPVAILVNKDSGSASELFAGVLQRQKRAVLFGVNTAGKVLLKSMYNFDDGSMLALVTARGYFPDGTVFDYQGLVPDYFINDDTVDLIQVAGQYLASQKTTIP